MSISRPQPLLRHYKGTRTAWPGRKTNRVRQALTLPPFYDCKTHSNISSLRRPHCPCLPHPYPWMSVVARDKQQVFSFISAACACVPCLDNILPNAAHLLFALISGGLSSNPKSIPGFHGMTHSAFPFEKTESHGDHMAGLFGGSGTQM
jgi:hypothetical protein